MAQSSWPFENIDTNETQFSQWARNIGEGVKTGALNELEVFADSTGMQVKVRSGQALVRGHYYQNTAEVTLTLEAADATNPRIDTVILELDPSANTITLQTITGVAESSPSAEPVVQTDAGIYQIKLADIAVGASVTTITAGNVTDTRFYIEDFSGTVPGSAITGEITTATMDGDRLFNAIDSATIPAANVTGLQTDLDGKQDDVITTEGDLVIGNGSGEASRLGIGSADQVLTSNGTTATWEDAGGGGMTLLSTTTLSGSTVEITNIDQTYVDLYVAVTEPVLSAVVTLMINPMDGGTLIGASGIRIRDESFGNYQSTQIFAQNVRSGTRTEESFNLKIHNYTSNKAKRLSFHAGYFRDGDNVPGGEVILGGTYRNNPVNKMQIFANGGSFSGGTVEIWGIK